MLHPGSLNGPAHRRGRALLATVAVATASLIGASCGYDDPTGSYNEVPDIVGDAIAFGIWGPSGTDTCSPEVHDGYMTVGPDGLRIWRRGASVLRATKTTSATRSSGRTT